MNYSAFELQIEEGVAIVTLAQPQRGNPFDGAFCSEFAAIANRLAVDHDVRAVLIRARGPYFSVGGDIQQFVAHLDDLPSRIQEWTSTLHMGLARLARLDAPVIACVEGVAMGGAVALIASCDLVYCGRSVKLGAAYTSIGYSCDAGASQALAQRMGLARARRYLLLGESLKGEHAEQVGLVDFCVDDAQVWDTALAQARALANGPTRAYGQIRRLMARALSQPLELQLEDEAQGLARIAASEDAREGLRAFIDKRKPAFRGC